MTGLIDFSVDATTNGTSAPPINFVEGQPANTVNNSMRALMAALARWRDDNSGKILAGGVTSNTLTVRTAQGVTDATLVEGLTVSFRVNGRNTGPVTLVLDDLAGQPLRRPGNIELGPGDLTSNTVYSAIYSVAAGAFLILAPSFDAPGTISAFGSVAAIPPGWVRCDGAAVSRSAFKALFDAIGTAHGTGNGSSTFNVPDLDGRTVFGADNGKGRISAAVGGIAGTVGSVGGTQATALTTAQLPSHGHTGTAAAGGGVAAGTTGSAGGHDHGGTTGSDGGHTHTGSAQAAGGHGHSGTAATAGAHAHSVPYVLTPKVVFSNSDGNGSAVTAIGAGIAPPANSSSQSGNSDNGGDHSHSLTINAVSDHGHALTINNAPNHNHTISAAANHTHSTPAIAAHTHDVTIAATGDGDAHPNMPPGLVAVWAIKA